ncbi:MAG: hypothetical protein WCP52_05280 [Bacteroidota bacterium]
MNQPLHKWLTIAIINLNIVAMIGVILRYKIVFYLPFIDQKHLLHTHSHFAFSGWLTQILMTLLVVFLYSKGITNSFKKYSWLLLGNVFTAYGMLITFTIEGYGFLSITFSTLSIFVSYIFAIVMWKDLNRLNSKSSSIYWFKAGVVFNALSSIGAFALAYMMATHFIHQNYYLSSEFFYLHFQYNGWFFFVCMGLLIDKLEKYQISSQLYKTIFRLFFLACIPAYFLSALWMSLPTWVYILVVISALAQFLGWFLLVRVMFHHLEVLNGVTSIFSRGLYSVAAFAITIKLLLQIGSTYPPLSNMAFGFRPIVIGYLHLVLLGAITMFILGYIVANGFVSLEINSIVGLSSFVLGVIINEILLMSQGVSALKYESVPYINELLLSSAVVMFFGIFMFVTGQFKNKIELENIV